MGLKGGVWSARSGTATGQGGGLALSRMFNYSCLQSHPGWSRGGQARGDYGLSTPRRQILL